jgi:hypothetical protein
LPPAFLLSLVANRRSAIYAGIFCSIPGTISPSFWTGLIHNRLFRLSPAAGLRSAGSGELRRLRTGHRADPAEGGKTPWAPPRRQESFPRDSQSAHMFRNKFLHAFPIDRITRHPWKIRSGLFMQ